MIETNYFCVTVTISVFRTQDDDFRQSICESMNETQQLVERDINANQNCKSCCVCAFLNLSELLHYKQDIMLLLAKSLRFVRAF